MTTKPKPITWRQALNYIRGHTTCALSVYEWRTQEQGGSTTLEDRMEFIQERLEAILRVIGRFEDAERTTRVFNILGIEVGIDGKPIFRDGDVA